MPKRKATTNKKSRATQRRKKITPTKSSAKKSGLKSFFSKRSIFIQLSLILLIGLSFYLLFLEKKINQRFEGRVWKLPAHVYARPLELFVGKSISVKQLQFEITHLNYQKISGTPKQAAQYSYWNNRFNIKTRDFTFWDGKEPSRRFTVEIENNKVKKLYNTKNQTPIDLIRFDPAYLTGIFPAHTQDRILVKLNDVPDIFIKMLLLIEDRRYFSHFGVDPRSILRAFITNISSGKTLQGGSTLTQQLVKNLFLNQQKKLSRKINEALMALLLEFNYDKKLILETYLNEIYLGQDGKRAIHGFGLASQFYFGKKLKQLSIDQLALLVGMVKGASYYNPHRNKKNAKNRRDIVLKTMQSAKLISPQQAKKFILKPIRTVKPAHAGVYPAFIDLVKIQLQQNYQADDLSSEGLQVFTTLDPFVQYETEQAIKKVLPTLSKNKKLQTAAVVLSPNNGDVIAIVGDKKPTYKGFNRALNAQRLIGSLIKPVIYLKALENPSRYTLATKISDTPLSYKIKNQANWQPENFDKLYHGDVTLYQSLIKSYNIPAVRTALDIGFKNIASTLNNLGLHKKVTAYPSLALGAITLSPLQVASIYQTFSANGYHSPLRSVFAVLDKDKKPLQRYSISLSNQVKPEAVALVNSALIGVTQTGTARYLQNTMKIQTAGKTGTSDDLKDSWFAGFSGDFVAVVWIGLDNNKPTGLTGSSGALRIWQAFMQKIAYQSYQLPSIPSLVNYWIDTKNNQLADASCENAVELLFIEGSQPQQKSDCVINTEKPKKWLFDIFGSDEES